MKKLISMLILLLSTINISAVTLYTPNGKSFTTSDGGWPSYDSDWFEEYKDGFGPGTLYPNSEVLGEWEDGIWEYNCHVFAWNNWQGAARWSGESDMWKLGKPSPYNLMWRSYPDVWYTDTDNPIGIVSYTSASSSEAAICTYSGNHSARIVGDGSYFISKWGRNPIIKHPPTEVPTSYYSVDAYFKINPAYRPIGDGDPAGRDWETISNALSGITSGSLISVLSGTQSLSGNISVPSVVTLEIQSDATVNLSSYSITTSGGTLAVDSGATINSSNSHTRLITGSAIKGIYSTIASAMSAATSGQSIEVYGSHTLAANLTVPSGVTLTFKNGSDITLDSHTIQKGSGSLVVETGATFTPDIRLMSGSTVLGLYTSLDAAYGDGSDVEIRGTHTFADYYTVSSGRILKAESGSELRFPPGKYLNVYGTLHGNQADFTSTSGTWGGIRYRSAGSGTLDHCTMSHATYGIRSTSTSTSLHFTHNTISGCSYGIYCSSSSPEIRDNTISNCSGYGVYLYNSSAELESNRISGSKVYLNNSDASLENNLITGAYGNEAVYFYASSPELYYNTMSTENAFWALHATNGSDPVFGGPYTGNGTNYGYNALSTGFESDGVICASNGSVPWLGYGGYGAGYYGYGGNAILGGGLYPAAAMDATSCIFADWCWWGQTPAPPCYGDVTTYDPLSSDPGTGSTLSKSSPEPVMASHPEEKPGDEAAKALWEVAMGAVWEKNYTGALDDFQTLIRLYPASTYAYRALSMSVRLCREQKTRDMLTYLDELLTGVEDKTLRAVIKSRKVSEYRRMKDIEQVIALSREILAENPESIHETTALFDLFNLYQKDLADSVQAEYYLTELKTKYPEDELTGIARIDWGEDPEKVVIRKRTLPGQEEEILPEVFILGSAYPNPFNPVTRLTYSLPDAGDLVDYSGQIGQ